MKNLTELYKDYSTLSENVIQLYRKTVDGKEIDLDYFEEKGIDGFCDTKDETVVGMDDKYIYTESGEYSIFDANILDLMYFIGEIEE